MTLTATRSSESASAHDASIDRTAAALEASGIRVFVVDSGAQARAKALELIPVGSEVQPEHRKPSGRSG